jgi:hypothetical protein
MSNKIIAIHKIKNTLSLSENQAGYLEKLEFEELEQLRLSILDTVDMRRDEVWKRVAKVAGFMPNFMNAKVAEQVLGPTITANLSYYLNVSDVISIMKNLSIPFMAHTAEHMIPEQSIAILKAFPVDTLKKLVAQLIKNEKHIVISGFVEFTPINVVLQIVPTLPSPLDMLLISENISNKEITAKLFSSLSIIEMERLLKTAFKHKMYEEILVTYQYLDNNTIKKISDIVSKNNELDEFFKP